MPVIPLDVNDSVLYEIRKVYLSRDTSVTIQNRLDLWGSAYLNGSPLATGDSLPVVSVKNFGAIGNGIADDSVAIQAAIDYCVGGNVAAGVSNSRVAIAALYFPVGTYLTTVAPKVISVSGFQMFGASQYGSTIKVSGARTFGIELDGLRSCWIHDLRIIGTSGLASTDTVRDALALNWTTAAARSTSHVVLERILVHQLKYINGITMGFDSPGRQVDDCYVIFSTVNGQWASGDTTWWQVGMQSGNGTHGNVLNHNYISCASAINRYNVYANAVNVTWHGGDIGHGEVDFRHTGSMPLAVNGLRSETSQRLYMSDGGASYASMASFRNVLWNPDAIAADNRFIMIQYCGTYHLENINVAATAATPKIYVQSVAAFSIYVTVTGLQTRSAIDTLFETTVTAPTIITAIDYCQINASGQPIAPAGPAIWVKGYNQVSSVIIDGFDVAVVKLAGYSPSMLGKTGEYWASPVTRTAVATTSGVMYTQSVFVQRACTIDRIGAEVTILAAGSTISLGIYADDGTGQAGVLVIDAGTIDGGVVAAAEKTINQALSPGTYHLAALVQGGAPTVRALNSAWTGGNNSLVNALSGTAPRAGRSRGGISGTALPTPAGALAIASSIPAIAVRFA